MNRSGVLVKNLSGEISYHSFVSMYVRKEALISSQIEGIQCTLDDILDPYNENSAK